MALENEGKPSDFAKAADYFKRASDAGDADASYALGVLYKNGRGVEKDIRAAAEYFRRAAERDLAAGQVEYAIMQFNGVGVDRDRTSAIALLRKAAAQDNAVAQNRLAHIYAEGLGVEANPQEAREWRDRAHDAGLNDPSLDYLNNISVEKKPAPKATGAAVSAPSAAGKPAALDASAFDKPMAAPQPLQAPAKK
jgi:TPR repeat protein